MSKLPDSYERVYTRQGQRAHALASFMDSDVALCGQWAWSRSAWLGTGSQAEYDHAAALPLCKNCAKKLPETKENR